MTSRGPLITLLAGVATATVMLALSLNATPSAPSASRSGPPSQSGVPTQSQPLTPAPQPTTSQPTASRSTTSPTPAPFAATYAGRLTGTRGSIAVAVYGETAFAYLCDGAEFEIWMKGKTAGKALALSGTKRKASLTGLYDAGFATGSVEAEGRDWDFRIPVAVAPAGLYRATTTVRNVRVVAGWIVLADGSQVGVVTTGTQPAPAPQLNTSTRLAMTAGARLQAIAIDGKTGSF